MLKNSKITINKKQKRDILLLILFPILAGIVSLIVKANFFISTLLFFGPISFYLSYRHKKAIKKTLLFSFILSILSFILVDYIATINNAWYVANSIFPFRFLNILPIEDCTWGMGLIYSVVIFYEYFFDKSNRKIIGKKMKYFCLIFGVMLVLFFTIFFIYPELFYVNYVYFWLGLLYIFIPVFMFLFFYPSLFLKFIKTGIYFFFFTILLELTGVHLGQWGFPSNQYVGWIELFNNRFPFEEFFFFIMLTAIAILSYYEFFNDDRK